MPTANRAEYLEVDGVPLATAAWEVTNLEVLYSGAGSRGADRAVPYFAGDAVVARRLGASVSHQVAMLVVGSHDSDGDPTSDGRQGVVDNLDELKRDVFRPRQNTETGLVVARLTLPDETTRIADVHAVNWEHGPLGPSAVRGVFDLVIPAGLWRSETVSSTESPSISDGVPTNVVVPNSGTADQMAVTITIEGGATSTVRMSNLTWDSTGGTFLDFNGDTTDDVVIDTAAFTAVRDSVSVVGLVDHSGHERWLPLVPGNNTIEVAPTGADVTVTFDHYPPFS